MVSQMSLVSVCDWKTLLLLEMHRSSFTWYLNLDICQYWVLILYRCLINTMYASPCRRDYDHSLMCKATSGLNETLFFCHEVRNENEPFIQVSEDVPACQGALDLCGIHCAPLKDYGLWCFVPFWILLCCLKSFVFKKGKRCQSGGYEWPQNTSYHSTNPSFSFWGGGMSADCWYDGQKHCPVHKTKNTKLQNT